jgi:nucleotide-binding universal stress UspA family protein
MTLVHEADLEAPVHDATPGRILVPLDGSVESEDAIAVARELGARTGAPITLFAWQWDRASQWVVHHYLERVKQRWSVDADTETAWGDGTSWGRPVIEAVEREPRTLVCMRTHARSGVGDAVVGSIAEEVLRRTTAPIVLLGPHRRRRELAGPVLVPVDGSPEAETVLPLAKGWAEALGSEVELVTVVRSDAPGAAEVASGDVRESGYVEGLARDQGLERWEVLHGEHPASAIAEHAEEVGAAMVVTSTHGHSGLRRMVLGSVAMRVVHLAPCPVLVQRTT